MYKLVILLIILLNCSLLFAQWSESCYSPTQMISPTEDLVTQNVCMDSNNNVYFGWMVEDPFDNTSLNFYLRKYSEQGLPLWPVPVLVCTISLLGTPEDFDMVADNDNNIVIVLTKFRMINTSVGTNDIYIYKVSATGQILWNSIQLNDDSSISIVNFSPKLACTTENNIVAAWLRDADRNSIRVKVLNPGGTFLSGCSIESDNRDYETPLLMASDNGGFFVLYFEDTANVNTGMFVNKYNSMSQALWLTGAVAIQNLGGIVHQNIYLGSYVDLESDLAGGMFLSWSDDRNGDNIRNAYVQHIQTNGNLVFLPNGTLLSSHTIYSQKNPKICFDSETGILYAYASVNNNSSLVYRQLVAQKFNASGQPLWGDTGIYYLQGNTYQVVPQKAAILQDTFCMIYDWQIGDGMNYDDHIMVTGLNSSGLSVLQTQQVYISNTNGNTYDIKTCSNDRFTIVCWSQDFDNILYAMRLNANGSLGYQVLEPTGLQAAIENGTSVRLTWQGAISNIPVFTYKIYQNDAIIAQTAGNLHQYLVTHPNLVGTMTYNYYVTSYWAFGFASLPSNVVSVTITDNDDIVNPPTVLSLWAMPNPFKDRIRLLMNGNESKSPFHMDIYNIKGQLKRSIELSEDSKEYAWDGKDQCGAELSPGIYLVKLLQGTEYIALKVIKFR